MSRTWRKVPAWSIKDNASKVLLWRPGRHNETIDALSYFDQTGTSSTRSRHDVNHWRSVKVNEGSYGSKLVYLEGHESRFYDSHPHLWVSNKTKITHYDKMVDSLKVCGADTRFTASGYRFLCFTNPIAKWFVFQGVPRFAGSPNDGPEFRTENLRKIELLQNAASISSLLAGSNTTGIP